MTPSRRTPAGTTKRVGLRSLKFQTCTTADAEYEYFRAVQYCSDWTCEQTLDSEHHNLRQRNQG